MRTYINPQAEEATINALTALGFVEEGPGSFHLELFDDVAWLVEYDYTKFTLREWTGATWRTVADYFDGDLLTTTLDVVGAKAS